MKLNGWQRLWVFVSAPFVIGGAIAMVDGIAETNPDAFWVGVAVAMGIPAFTYAFGWGIAWVRRGFRE